MKKLICIVLIFSLLSVCFINVAGAENKAQLIEVEKADSPILIENDLISLLFDCSSCEIKITDKKSGASYSSVPSNEVSGLDRLLSMSMLVLTVLEDNSALKKVYSYSECVGNNSFRVFKSEAAIKIIYAFDEYKIKIPVLFSLNENTLEAKIETSEIEDKNSYLLDIALMPYFAAADKSEDGYMLIPDGSGALINFYSNRLNTVSAQYSVYGNDAMQKKEYKEADLNSLKLPMFAFCYNGEQRRSVTAYITSGDALATLNVSAASSKGGYNTAHFAFNYRPYTLTTLLDRTSKAQKLYIASSKTVDCKEFALSYRFSGGEAAQIGGIAKYVSDIIFKGKKANKKSTYPVFLDVYMSVYKQVYTLGIPHNATLALTTLKDCMEIAEDFNEPIMLLKGLDKYGVLSNKISSNFDLSGKIGSQKEYRKLSEAAEIYPLAKLTAFDKQSLLSNSIFHSARSVTGKSIKEYVYNPATLTANENSQFLLAPTKLYGVVQKYSKSIEKSGIKSIAPLSLGNSPYTDNKRSDRQKTMDTFLKSLECFSDNGLKVLLENPDGYALRFADAVISLPTSSSKNRIIDTDIPFIQMVLGRYLTYGGAAVNQSGDINSAVLECAATGSALTFSISGSDYTAIRDTDLDYLYSADYSFISEDAKTLSKQYAKRMKKTAESYIADYKILDNGISLTLFDNGMTVAVNRSNTDFTLSSGITIPAEDYILIESEVEF